MNKHLPNLDPLRFFAAATVVFYHVDAFLLANHYKNAPLIFFPFEHGDLAVVFFFVLSGFLITYLLLVEKEERAHISIKKFYLKRIFRIWPLYFLIVILAFSYFNFSSYFFIDGPPNVIDAGKHLVLNIILLLLIAPNVALLSTTSLGYANPTWSIGVEEQFYLLWPWLIRSKHYFMYILYIIVIMYLLSNGIVARGLTMLVKYHILEINSVLYTLIFKINKFFTFWASFKIDAMAIGAIGAHLFVKRSWLLQTLYSRSFQIFTWSIFVILIFFHHVVPYQVYAIIFMLIILNISTNPDTIINIPNRTLNYLGKISYGIYMYHLLTVIPAIKFVTTVCRLPVNIYTEILICFISLILTIAIAFVSFNTFEIFFLRIKDRLTAYNHNRHKKVVTV
ncbi:MAG TPA: acyltransferase [Mucilaginibacter sp.]|jgi:peptidoglycan/LPS O-acetylase OafA/YrhL|nr:acyltransferase [Mucilaginibacter sp.]